MFLVVLMFVVTTVLTLSVRAEYIYSAYFAVSRASCPDGVLILRNFHKVLK
jgi:hypothetical protein